MRSLGVSSSVVSGESHGDLLNPDRCSLGYSSMQSAAPLYGSTITVPANMGQKRAQLSSPMPRLPEVRHCCALMVPNLKRFIRLFSLDCSRPFATNDSTMQPRRDTVPREDFISGQCEHGLMWAPRRGNFELKKNVWGSVGGMLFPNSTGVSYA